MVSCCLTDVLSSKETLMRESMSNGGYLKRATARNLIKIDVNKTGRIFDFFESCGWINRLSPKNEILSPLPPISNPPTQISFLSPSSPPPPQPPSHSNIAPLQQFQQLIQPLSTSPSSTVI